MTTLLILLLNLVLGLLLLTLLASVPLPGRWFHWWTKAGGCSLAPPRGGGSQITRVAEGDSRREKLPQRGYPRRRIPLPRRNVAFQWALIAMICT